MKETKHTDIFSPSLCHFLRCENQIAPQFIFFCTPREPLRDRKGGGTAGSESVRLKVFFSCEKGDKIPGCGLKSALGKAVALALTDQLLSHTHCYSFTDTQCKMDIGWLKLLSTDWTELKSNRYK